MAQAATQKNEDTRRLLQSRPAVLSGGALEVAPIVQLERRGDKKAVVAGAHSILVIAYHVLRDGRSYRHSGP